MRCSISETETTGVRLGPPPPGGAARSERLTVNCPVAVRLVSASVAADVSDASARLSAESV
jgi:hypothetical protein